MKRTALRPRSVKASAEHRRYLAFVAELAAESDSCEVGPLWSKVDPTWRGCLGRMSGLHHLRKRSAGGALMDRANVLRSCSPCNGLVEDRPDLAHSAGLVIRRGDVR